MITHFCIPLYQAGLFSLLLSDIDWSLPSLKKLYFPLSSMAPSYPYPIETGSISKSFLASRYQQPRKPNQYI